MNDSEFQSYIRRELDQALGVQSGELSAQRAAAMRYYKGEPRGDEQEGRSKVISTDISDVIAWIMPKVIRAFGDEDATVEFESYGQEDEDAAKLESQYCDHVFFRQNNGLLVLHSWFQDALLEKNGYLKVWWDDTPEKERLELSGLSEMELQAIKERPDMEVVESSSKTEELQEIDIGLIKVTTYDAVVDKIVVPGRLVIDPIPGEETRINKDHRKVSLQEAKFAAHERIVMASELVEMGFDRELVDGLFSDLDEDEEYWARYNLEDERNRDDPTDPALRRIAVAECYALADRDGDGIAERKKVIFAGNQIIEEEDAKRVALISITPFPLSHKHIGQAVYDKIKQIQDIKTALWRQILDNTYLHNNGRHVVVEGQVTIQDLLHSRPGGIVRQKAPGMIEPLVTPALGQQVYQFLDYIDSVRETRTGVGPETYSEIGQLAQQTAWGVERLMSVKEELIGLMTAIFRETGVRELFEHIHEVLRENQDWPVKANIGEWQEINPSQWPKRTTKASATWSGIGDKVQKQRSLGHFVGLQQQLMQNPGTAWMVGPGHVYELMTDLGSASGIEADQYMMDPTTPEGQMAYQQFMQAQQQTQQPDPAVVMAQINAQATMAVEQVRAESRKEVETLKEANKRDIESLKEANKREIAALEAKLTVGKEMQDAKEHMDEMQAKMTELELKYPPANVPGSAV